MSRALILCLVATACGPEPPSTPDAPGPGRHEAGLRESPCGLERGPGTRGLWCIDDASTGPVPSAVSGAPALDGGRLETPHRIAGAPAFTVDVAVRGVPSSNGEILLDATDRDGARATSIWLRLSADADGSVTCASGRAGSIVRATSEPGLLSARTDSIVTCQRHPGGRLAIWSGGDDVTARTDGHARRSAGQATLLHLGALGCDRCTDRSPFAGRVRGLAVHARRTAGPFHLVVLPDTQYYVVGRMPMLNAQIAYLVRNRDRLNVPFVFHEGDCVQHDTNDDEWRKFAGALEPLDRAGIPYALSVGNHDYPENGTLRESHMSRHFRRRVASRPWFGGSFEPGVLDDAWYTFEAGSDRWMVLSLEFGPRDDVLAWARRIAADHPDHRLVVVTHAYVFSDDTLQGAGDEWSPVAYPIQWFTGEANDGLAVWHELVRRHPRASFVFSGHVIDDGTGLVVDTGDHGNRVYQMLANYQMVGDGGDGWLRLVLVDLERDYVSVRTYSPWKDEWWHDADQEFDFRPAFGD